MTSSKKCQLNVLVGAQWSTGGSYPLYRFEIYPDKLHVYLRFAIFGHRPSCTILKDNILEIKRVKFLFFKGLKILHNDFRYTTFVAIFFGSSKDVLKTERMLDELHYPIDLNSKRERINISKYLKELTTNGDGSSK